MNITTATTAANQPAAAAEKTKPDALGQDAFLKILIAQLKYQDPMEPQKDAEFIGQMAQFSSLEQLTQLNKTMTGYAGEGGSASLAGSAHLLGTEVSWSANEQAGTGIVKAVTMKNGEIMVELEGEETKIPLSAIERIEQQGETKNEQVAEQA
ncbi:flagellar hook capping FlgD N-terminal domain-containing protein [Planococcus sp. SIMBA_143]